MLLPPQQGRAPSIVGDMRVSLLMVVALAACSSGGGSAPIQPATADIPKVSPTASAAPVASSTASPRPSEAPLRFVWTDFHFEVGTSVMEVDETQVIEVFSDHRMKVDAKGQRYTELFHRRASYVLSAAEAARLRGALTADAFWALDARYMHPGIEDGTTQTFTVSVGDRKKDVYCYHQWPEPVAEVKRVLRDVREAHEAERKAAPEVGPEDVERAEQRANEAAKRAGRKMP